jgi:heptaprenyl diphosphate synthase/octaprenyl-diphosphate synthase
MYEPIRERLTRVEESLKGMASLRFPLLAETMGHAFGTGGKKVRPAITLLASQFHSHDTQKTETMATAVELLHIATLIHDDTVDNSDMRRGRATVSSLWGRNVAVLVGDYIFAASATFVCDTGNIRVIRRFAETIMELSSGELQEIGGAYDWHQTLEQYLERIYNKTASLFSTAGESGAVLSGVQEESVQALKMYGYNLGMAFQIVDDILDFQGTKEEIGKPVGNDLAQGIVTLPTLMLMKRYPDDNPIPALFGQPHNEEYLRRAVDMALNSSAIDESYSVAEDFCRKALDNLMTLPKNPSRDSLEELAHYVLTRRR